MSEPSKPSPGLPQIVNGDELVRHLRETLDRAANLAGALSEALARISPQQPQENEHAFQERLRAAENDAHDLASRLVESENQLGRLTGMDPATMFGVASRLAKRNLVRQSVDPADARLVILRLTDEGHALVEAMKARGIEVSRRTLAPLTAEEGETLCRLLRKIT